MLVNLTYALESQNHDFESPNYDWCHIILVSHKVKIMTFYLKIRAKRQNYHFESQLLL